MLIWLLHKQTKGEYKMIYIEKVNEEKMQMVKEKISANELAKKIVLSSIDSAYCWNEQGWSTEGMTEKEIEQVNKMVDKQATRVKKLLG